MSSNKINFTIDARAIYAGWEREANEITHIVTAACMGADLLKDGEALVNKNILVTIGTAGTMTQDLRTGVHSWLLGSALVQVVESLSRAVDDFRRCCVIAKVGQNSRVQLQVGAPIPQTFRDAAVLLAGEEEVDKHTKRGLVDKLDRLKSEFGLQLPAVRQELTQIQQLRNCLIHRFGIVGTEDVDQSGRLTVVFHDIALVAVDVNGVECRLDKPQTIQAGSTLELKFGLPRTQQLELGGRIQLTATDLTSVCWMCLTACRAIAQEVAKYLQTHLRTDKQVD